MRKQRKKSAENPLATILGILGGGFNLKEQATQLNGSMARACRRTGHGLEKAPKRIQDIVGSRQNVS